MRKTLSCLALRFFFQVFGMMYGTDINSISTSDPPAGRASESAWSHSTKDISQYKTMIYRTQIDFAPMGPDANISIRNNTRNP